MDRVEAIVIGAGVVGLAVARALAQAGREVVILEAGAEIGSHTSSRNSEVIHGGLYYPTGSLKAETCVAGKHALYAYCAEKGIDHRQCGKLIVATADDQLPALEALKEKAAANGVPDLIRLTPDEAARFEPAVRCVGALFSPSTGIVDSHGLMLAYQGDAEAAGAMLALNTPVERVAVDKGGFTVETGGPEPLTLGCDLLINAAGLFASFVADTIDGLDAKHIPRTGWCKGNYFTLAGRNPFDHLVYPMPDGVGLGVHVTLDLGGQARFGPDTQWLPDPSAGDRPDYTLSGDRMAAFEEAIRKYWPDLPDGSLVPGYTGIRPKLQRPGEPAADFLIQGPATHGVPGLINMFGIESPGLTASLALADRVIGALDRGSLAA